MMFKNVILAAAALVTMVSAANAVPIAANSSINLNGYVQGNGSTSLMMATSLDFTAGSSSGASVGTPGVLSSYDTGTGTFAGISCKASNCGSIKDISTLAVGAQTISNFVSLTGGNNTSAVNFTLTSIDSVTRNIPGFLLFTATGLINYDGFDQTAGTFLFSAQGNAITSFSGTTFAAAAVPEPMSLALLGGALATVGLIRRKKA